MGAIPLPWKIAGGFGLLLALVLAIGGVYLKGRSDGEALIEVRVAQAVVDQKNRDQELSARLLAEQRESLNALHAQALSSLKVVSNAPVTSTCGPVQRDASRGVRAILRGGPASP